GGHGWGGGAAGGVNGLWVWANGGLVAGGWFSAAGLVAARGVARWDGSSWSAIGAGVHTPVRALCERPNGEIFADEMRWDGNTWSEPVPGFHFESDLKALAVLANGDGIAAGNYTSGPGVPAVGIAGWNGASWYLMGTGISNLGGPWALAAVADGDLIVGGRFATAGGVASGFLARWTVPSADFDHDGVAATDA